MLKERELCKKVRVMTLAETRKRIDAEEMTQEMPKIEWIVVKPLDPNFRSPGKTDE